MAHFCAAERPGLLWDMGCNTGDYAVTALEAGARQVVGVDADIGAVEQAYHRAKCGRLDFLPLHMAVTNPSPSQGWAETERGSMSARARADALLALALVHHLAIAGNVPLGLVVDWLVSLAPKGVVEFVPKADPMVAHLLRLREDIFDDYSLANFESRLSARATIVKTQVVSDSGRTLYWFERL